MSIADRVQAIIEDQGETVTYQRITAGSRNAGTLTKTNTVTEYAIKAHFRLFKANDVAGLIQDGDSQCRIAANSITFIPTTSDKIVTAYKTFVIYQVDTRKVGDTLIEYIIHARALDV